MWYLNPKFLVGLGILLFLVSSFFYVKHLNSSIEHLKEENVKLEEVASQNEAAIKEDSRRSGVINSINGIGNKERVIIKKNYDNKLKGIDESVTQGKDRPVGPLLNDFFSDGLHNN